MITTDQQKWIDHLSDVDRIRIIPFDPTCEHKFQAVKSRIVAEIGNEAEVLHCGASSMGISGQDEIDVYVPVRSDQFDKQVGLFTGLFGKPRSLYSSERARFVTDEGGKHIDVFVINREHESWKNALKFEEYLRRHSVALNEYRELKEAGNGLSVREYYRRKIEFINDILERHEKDV